MVSPLNANLPPNLPPIGPRRVVYLEANRPPTTADTKYRDGSYYEFDTEWRDKSTTPPNIYKLSNILSKTNAVWVLVTGGSGTIINIDVDAATAPGVDPVSPTGAGLLTITGGQVATGTVGTNVIRTHTTALNQFAVEIQRSTAAAGTDVTLNGVSHFNSAQFTVDGNGFVSLAGGGAAIDSINVDASTPPGTDPVLPDGAGQITVTGAQVAPGTVGANVIRTNSLAANTYRIEIQQTDTAASKDTTKNGVAHFNSAQFTDDEGFISMIAAGPPAMSFNVDANTGPGTDPVIPSAGGAVTITGGQVASGTVGANVIRTDSLAANTYTVEIQRTAAVAATDSTQNGVSHFNSAEFNVDSNGFVSLSGSTTFISENLGISYNAGTGVFAITSSDGTALSATNPGYVTLQSKVNPGQLITHTITANQDFIDDVGASQIIGNLFGFTSGVAITVDVPFFIYAVTNDTDDAIAFMCGRTPHKVFAPVAADIGVPGTPGTNSQASLFAFEAITPGDYDGNPVVCVGSFRMRMSAADDWTVQTITVSQGINEFQNNIRFTIPLGQFGANSGTLTKNNGGTAPVFSSVASNLYNIHRDGTVWVDIQLTGTDGSSGAGAVNAQVALPFTCDSLTQGMSLGIVSGTSYNMAAVIAAAANVVQLYQDGATDYVKWNAYDATNRNISINFAYRAGS